MKYNRVVIGPDLESLSIDALSGIFFKSSRVQSLCIYSCSHFPCQPNCTLRRKYSPKAVCIAFKAVNSKTATALALMYQDCWI